MTRQQSSLQRCKLGKLVINHGQLHKGGADGRLLLASLWSTVV